MESGKLIQIEALDFITAGHATFTIKNVITGNRFTYKVQKPRQNTPENASLLFVSVLRGTNNETNYSYIGTINIQNGLWQFKYGKKAKISFNVPSVYGFYRIFNQILALRNVDARLEVWHDGHCCRCGRILTVPESIETGIGPECARIKTKHNHQ